MIKSCQAVLKSRPISRVGVKLDGPTFTLHDNDGEKFTINAQVHFILTLFQFLFKIA